MAKVLLIVFDSLRKDVFDASRHPLLEEWRQEGLSFENCYSQSGFTPLSFASILSGLFPSQNGARCTVNAGYRRGEMPRETGPVWWNVDEEGPGHLVIPGSRPPAHTAFSLFEKRLLTWRYSKSNLFPGLGEEEMTPSPEHGSDLDPFYRACELQGGGEDFLLVLRIYDTHLPYGRGISPCDAGSNGEIREKLAALFARDGGRTLLEVVARPALERALDYLTRLWPFFKGKLDFCAIMSDHGDNWSGDPEYVGHGRFLTPSVLHVPLLVLDGMHRGACYNYCNNSQVVPTMLALTGKTPEPHSGYQSLPFPGGEIPPLFETEANAMDGRYLKTTITNPPAGESS